MHRYCCRQLSTVVVLLLASVSPGFAQNSGIGTPVIVPPILDGATQNGEQLVVPAKPSAVPVEATPVAPVKAPSVKPEVTQPEAQAPAVSQPAAPSTRTSSIQAIGDWSLECFDPAFETGACQILHRVVTGQGAQVVLVFSLSANGTDDPANIQIALPLGVSLSHGVQLVIGSEYQNRVPISRCTPQGCLVEGTVTTALLAAMRKEKSGTVVVVNERGEDIRLPFSLIGFSDSFEQMIKKNAG